jgi:ribosomal protein S17
MSFIVLRGRWCNIIVLNAHAPTEEKGDYSNGGFYEELEGFFYHFPKYHMKILLGDFNAKVGREDTFKLTMGNESLHQDSNDNGVRVVNFATSKNLVVKSTMFPHRNIHKYTWTSPDGKAHNQINHILIGNGIRVYSTCDLSGEVTVILTTIWWLQKLGKDWQ